MNILYEAENIVVVEKPEADHGLHILVRSKGSLEVGIWDAKSLVKNLLNDLKQLKEAVEVEKLKRFI